MREDEDVAQATGVNTTNFKLLAFALGASIGSLGGAVFATHLESVFPGSFVLQVSITTLAVVVLGGMGSIPGVVVGAFVLIGLPEMLREFAEFKLLVYGATLVLVMILRPEGLLPDVGRRRELHEAEENEELARGAAPKAPLTTEPWPPARRRRRPDILLRATKVTKAVLRGLVANRESTSTSLGTRSSRSSANGAGKTTFFNQLSGVYHPTEGTIAFEDIDISDMAPTRLRSWGRPHLPEHPAVPGPERADQRIGGPARRTKGQWYAAVFQLPSIRREEAAIGKRSYELLEIVGLRRSAAHVLARTCHTVTSAGSRWRAPSPAIPAAPSRRADGRHEPWRDPPDDRVHRSAPPRPEPHHPAHRARHEGGHGRE
jgi:hypothetical protein